MKSRILAMFALVTCSVPFAGCASHEAAPPMTAAEHEAVACRGVPLDPGSAGSFGPSAEVASVTPLVEPVLVGKQTYSRVSGAKVTVVASPGLTKQWVARLAQCQTARQAAGADNAHAWPSVTVSVADAPTSFVVSLRATGGADDAERVLRLSEGMLPGHGDRQIAKNE